MDFGHLSANLRSGLAQLPARDRFAAYELEKESSRWCSVDRVCSATRRHRVCSGHEPNRATLSFRQGAFHRRGEQDSSGMVQVNAPAVSALGHVRTLAQARCPTSGDWSRQWRRENRPPLVPDYLRSRRLRHIQLRKCINYEYRRLSESGDRQWSGGPSPRLDVGKTGPENHCRRTIDDRRLVPERGVPSHQERHL